MTAGVTRPLGLDQLATMQRAEESWLCQSRARLHAARTRGAPPAPAAAGDGTDSQEDER